MGFIIKKQISIMHRTANDKDLIKLWENSITVILYKSALHIVTGTNLIYGNASHILKSHWHERNFSFKNKKKQKKPE